MRSSWELAVAHRLDAIGEKWWYEFKPVTLPSGLSYTPDFLLSDGSWIEVKGRQYPRAMSKVEELRSLGEKVLVIGLDNIEEFTGICAKRIASVYADWRVTARLR